MRMHFCSAFWEWQFPFFPVHISTSESVQRKKGKLMFRLFQLETKAPLALCSLHSIARWGNVGDRSCRGLRARHAIHCWATALSPCPIDVNFSKGRLNSAATKSGRTRTFLHKHVPENLIQQLFWHCSRMLPAVAQGFALWVFCVLFFLCPPIQVLNFRRRPRCSSTVPSSSPAYRS